MREVSKYFKYNMGSALMNATIERKVLSELQHKKDFPMRMFAGFLGVGLMIFFIMLGAVILMNGLPAATSSAPVIPTLVG